MGGGYWLTPAQRAKLEHIAVDVDIVDAPQEEVEVEALNGHPGETAEQGVVQDSRQRHACSPSGHSQHGTQEEGDIQQQH